MTLSASLVLLLGLASPSRIAVLDVKARVGVSAELAQGIQDALVEEVRRQVKPTPVIGSDDVRAMIGLAKQKMLLGCQQDVSCLTEIGGALGVERMVVATLGKFGDTYLLVARLIDVTKSKVLASASERLAGNNDAKLLDSVARVAKNLFAPPSMEPPPASVAAAPAPAAPPQSMEVEAETPEPSGPTFHPRPLAIALGAVGIVALGVAFAGIANVAAYASYQGSAVGTHPALSDVTSRVNSANTWANVAVGLGIVGCAGVTGALLTW